MKTRKFLILLLVLVLVAFFITNFSSIYTIDDYAYAIAMGIDKSTNDLDLLLTLQIAIPSGSSNSSSGSSSSSSQSSSSIVSTVKCKNIDDGINKINDYLGEKLNLSYCKVIVFSEDVARNGVGNYICTATNNIELRPSCDIIVSKCKAQDYIQNSKPLLESLSSKYYKSISSSQNDTGFTKTVSLMSFYNKYFDTLSEPFAPLSNLEISKKEQNKSNTTQGNQTQENNSNVINQNSTSENQSAQSNSVNSENENIDLNSITSENQTSSSSSSSTENKKKIDVENDNSNTKIINSGLAVFRSDKLVGEISEEEALCYMLVSGKLNNATINIPSPFSDSDFISLNISSVKSKNKVQLNGDSPQIFSDITLEARVLSSTKSSNYMSKENISAIEYTANSYLKANITDFLYKTSKDLKSDFIGFGRIAVKSFKTIDDWKKYDWLAKYENASFSVNVNTRLKSSYLIIGWKFLKLFDIFNILYYTKHR